MAQTYKNILSPLVVQGVVLRNRLYGTKGLPHFQQGQEAYPSENVLRYYANLAKNGAAVVTVKGMSTMRDRTKMMGDSAHMTMWDIKDPGTHNYMAQLANLIHYYGSKVFINIQHQQPNGVNISEVTTELYQKVGAPMGMSLGREITKDEIKAMIQDIVNTCKTYQSLGFDGVNLYSSYQASIWANSFSPLVNRRNDEYGGDLDRRCQLIVETAQAIKAACGNKFLVELQFSGEEGQEGGYTIDDTAYLLKKAEGLIDIIQIRAVNGDLAHPVGLNSDLEAPITLAYSEYLKKAGVKTICAPNGGYQDPELIDKWISEGKMDMAAICRGFIADFEYYEKILDGKGEDVVPCIRCNNCHGINFEGPWYSFCSVNPEMGIESRKNLMAPPATTKKKVAVIGGGPTGMRAAITARQRGHEVTLFEKKDVLGGQLIHADYAQFKWPLRRYKDWLVVQLYKTGVEVKLSCAPTPEEIENAGFDAVIAATGAVAKRPNIPGAENQAVWTPLDVFGNEDKLGKKVVVIGGSETGMETALYLCDHGHDVTVITRQGQLASDANQIHYIGALRHDYNSRENFHYATNATTTEVSPTSVKFTVKNASMGGMFPGMPPMGGKPGGETLPGMPDLGAFPGMPPMGGKAGGDTLPGMPPMMGMFPMPGMQGKPGPYSAEGEYTIDCDSVVVCGGVAPEMEEGLKFSGSARQFFLIGDCNEPGRVADCTRAAYAAASQI